MKYSISVEAESSYNATTRFLARVAPLRYKYREMAYVFSSDVATMVEGEKCTFGPVFPEGHTAAKLFRMYAGRTVQECEIWIDLVVLPSPTGKRTMWDSFNEYRRHMLRTDILRRRPGLNDPLVRLQMEMVIDEIRSKLMCMEVVEGEREVGEKR